jgi:hypothetical protein
VGLLIKADAKHADQGFKRQRAVIGDRLPHLIKSLLAVFTAMTDRVSRLPFFCSCCACSKESVSAASGVAPYLW